MNRWAVNTAKLDEKNRVRIPKKIREAVQLAEGSCVNIKAEGKAIIIRITLGSCCKIECQRDSIKRQRLL
ncbi:MAG: AbrB/MazE/SpoVT family DNA-binding domain-containing protein [Candidatus Bathyarchaeia archaeon]